MKHLAFFLIVSIVTFFIPAIVVSQEPEIEIEPESVMTNDKDMKDLARTAFLVKGKDGKEWLCIRLTVRQYNAAKDRADGNSIVRIVLTARQHLAIKNALGLDKIASKLIIRAKAERFMSSRGIKGRYIIRPASYFRDLVSKTGEVEETDSAENPPDTIFDLITEE